ncbi:MAG: caspase domain-containing protein, partial [Spirochaetaceae bacterium]
MNKLASFFLLTAGASLLLLSSCQIDPDPPDRYALVYGVSDYSNSPRADNLKYTDDDAYEVGKLLADKGYTVYLRIDDGDNSENRDVSYAKNLKSASADQLDDDLAMMENILKEHDILVFTFSGHGTYDPTTTTSYEDGFSDPHNEYLLLYPTVDASEKMLLSDDALGAAMTNLPSKKNVILLDACHSGGFINKQNDVDRINPEYSSDSEYRSNIFKLSIEAYFNSSNVDIPPSEAIVISASGEQESSWETGSNDNGHGFLSRGILDSASGGDINNDGYIDTREIYYYTRRYIEKYWNPNWRQIQEW